MVITTEANISSGAKARLERLVPARRNGCGESDAGASLPCSGLRYAACTRRPPVPEVAIEREPEGRLPTEILCIVTQVTFKRTDRALRFRPRCGRRKGFLVRGEEPYTHVAIRQPLAKALRVANSPV